MSGRPPTPLQHLRTPLHLGVHTHTHIHTLTHCRTHGTRTAHMEAHSHAHSRRPQCLGFCLSAEYVDTTGSHPCGPMDTHCHGGLRGFGLLGALQGGAPGRGGGGHGGYRAPHSGCDVAAAAQGQEGLVALPHCGLMLTNILPFHPPGRAPSPMQNLCVPVEPAPPALRTDNPRCPEMPLAHSRWFRCPGPQQGPPGCTQA